MIVACTSDFQNFNSHEKADAPSIILRVTAQNSVNFDGLPTLPFLFQRNSRA